MKFAVAIFFLFVTTGLFAQKKFSDLTSIDKSMLSLEASSPADLAQKIVAKYEDDVERTRAIFSWVAQHISYSSKFNGNNKGNKSFTVDKNADTSSLLQPLDERVAQDVMKSRTARCYGYSRLFKCVCYYAGIRCELINGYARGDFNKIGNNFRTNHTWNAVQLDGVWYLIDVAWSSGYFTYANEFIKQLDDKYFITAPEIFAQDHFPDDLAWTLLEQPFAINEFKHSPYKSRCFNKYNIKSYSPSGGVINTVVGDTIILEVQVDMPSDRKIAGGPIDDDRILPAPADAIYCTPADIKANVVKYTHVVQSSSEQWLQLVYNNDMILRYKLAHR